jgi:hypothetical protein
MGIYKKVSNNRYEYAKIALHDLKKVVSVGVAKKSKEIFEMIERQGGF